MKLLTTLFLGTSIVAMAFVTHKDVSVRHTAMDTQVKFISTNFSDLVGRTLFDTLPKYRYFFILSNTEGYLHSEDSVKMVLQNVGMTMSVADSRQQIAFAFAHLHKMEQYFILDSALIETKPIVKKGGKP